MATEDSAEQPPAAATAAAEAAAATTTTNGGGGHQQQQQQSLLAGGHGTRHEFGPNVHISSHPVLSHKITLLRSSVTKSGQFRAVLREVTSYLAYEATSQLHTKPVAVSVPIPASKIKKYAATKVMLKEQLEEDEHERHLDCRGYKLSERIALVPILRSGLGMTESMQDVLPSAASYHIGMYKIAGQDPVLYFNRLPRKCTADIAYVLDPVIATASTVLSVVKILKKVM